MPQQFVVFFNETVAQYNFSTLESFKSRFPNQDVEYDGYSDVESAVLACQRCNKKLKKKTTTKINKYFNLTDYEHQGDFEGLGKTHSF